MNLRTQFLILLVFQLGLGARLCIAEPSAEAIKATYVLNFIKFVEWPAPFGVNTNDKVTLCVVGDNVLGGALSTLDGRKAGNRELHVVQHTSTEINLSNCQVVFIGESEQRHFVSIIKSLDDLPVLTISDIDDFAEKGGCIGLRDRENKIIFEVNLAPLQRSKLHLPGQLLNLSSYVFGRVKQGGSVDLDNRDARIFHSNNLLEFLSLYV